MRKLKRSTGALFLLAGCARMGNPPGAPPDFRAPQLLATYPESTTVLPNFKGTVDFKFDETVSEGSQPNFGTGSGDLERLVLLSPSKQGEVPRVEWHRSRISVRPRDGWRPNTVYRVELAPGLRDLTDGGRNEVKVSHVITFATGGTLPTRAIEGRAVDWVARRFMPRALVEAMLLPDSLVYRTVADSTGTFRMGPLPDGMLLITVTNDQNRNSRRDPKEAWDTVRMAAGGSRVGEVWTFVRDTLPPKAMEIARTDSIDIVLTLAQPIDPTLTIPADSIRVLLLPDSLSPRPDSVSLGPVSALPKAAHDSIYVVRGVATRATAQPNSTRPDNARPDSTTRTEAVQAAAAKPNAGKRGASDTLLKDEPQEKRLALGSQLVVRTRGATVAGRSYFVEVRGVRSAGGSVGTVASRLVIKPPPRVKTDSIKADSTKAKIGTTTRRPDTSAVHPRPRQP